MIRKFCFISTMLVLIFTLSTASLSQETKKPDYMKEKEQAVKKETPKEEVKKTGREIEKLSEQLEEMEAAFKELSADSDEGKNVKERMMGIQKKIAQLRAKGERKQRAKRKPVGRNLEANVKELRVAIAKDRDQIAELKRTHPDSPKLKELQQSIAAREDKLERLIAQSRRVRVERPPIRRVEPMQLKIFQFKHIDVETAFRIIKPFVKGKTSVIVPVGHTKSLIIKDTQKNLRDIESIAKHIDVEAQE